ncbi:MAG: hypothetical protein AAFQ80_23265 [Cyanobacteria bacterium J06621_8]
MTALGSNIQKLEALLKSATNPRQRQMYQSLLTKARQELANQESLARSQQVAESKVNQTQRVPSSGIEIRAASSTSTEKQKQSKPLAKEVSSKANAKNSETKRKTSNSDRPAEVKQTAQKQVKKTKSNQQSESDHPTIFQAVGLIKCMTQIKEDRLYITIDGQAYELKRGQKRTHQKFEELKREIEQNGSKELWLRVYPKIVHDSINEEIRYWFNLVKAFKHKSQCRNQQEGFILRGIWQYIPYCCEPVISIHRNVDRFYQYKRLPPGAKKNFARVLAFPVIWHAPVEPFRYNPELDRDQQMPRYFVQVRAVFEDDQFEVIEEIEQPTLDIPRYIKPRKKDIKPKPENS